jgi:hypothetical protein
MLRREKKKKKRRERDNLQPSTFNLQPLTFTLQPLLCLETVYWFQPFFWGSKSTIWQWILAVLQTR